MCASMCIVHRKDRGEEDSLTPWTYAFSSQVPQHCKVIGGGDHIGQLERERERERDRRKHQREDTRASVGETYTAHILCIIISDSYTRHDII